MLLRMQVHACIHSIPPSEKHLKYGTKITKFIKLKTVNNMTAAGVEV